MKKILFTAIATMILPFANIAHAATVEFETFNIRNNGSSITAPWDSGMFITENSQGNGFEALTPLAGQKLGYGTNAFDGMQINQFSSVNFTKVSGAPNKLPYLNFWITDGANYAIVALGGDYRGNDFQINTNNWLLYEYDTGINLNWLFDDSSTTSLIGHGIRKNGLQIKLADLGSNILLGDPGGPYPGYVGTGAPRGGYGFNVLWGDTQANYVGPMVISDLTIGFNGNQYNAGNTIPEPAPLALLAFGLVGLAVARKRKK